MFPTYNWKIEKEIISDDDLDIYTKNLEKLNEDFEYLEKMHISSWMVTPPYSELEKSFKNLTFKMNLLNCACISKLKFCPDISPSVTSGVM